MLEISGLEPNTAVLDVGCGIGGTTRHLAREHGCAVTGVTISGRQVQIARRLTAEESGQETSTTTGSTSPNDDNSDDGFTPLGSRGGRVRYQELDAEKMESHFAPASFDCVWIAEALSHFPDKALFFRNAARVLSKKGTGTGKGKLVIADWFRAADLTDELVERDIRPIEGR